MNNLSSFYYAVPLGVSLGLGLASCGEPFTATGSTGGGNTQSSASGGTGGMDAAGGMGGEGGTGGTGGGAVAPAPTPVHPSPNQVLTPTQAYFSWNDGTVPSGLTVDHYQFCWTSGPMTDIDTDAECPNPSTPKTHRQVVAPLTKNATYLWKVREVFSDATKSAFSGVQVFKTDDSAVEWLPMDEGSGTTTADSSGNSNNGTLVNSPTWVTGFVGKALQFGGMSYVSVADAASLNPKAGDFSLTAQIKTSSSGARQAIVEKYDSGNGYYFYVLASGALGFFGANCNVAATAGNVADGKWHHVAASRSGSTVTLYIDGATTVGWSGTCADDFSNASVLAVGCNAPSLGCVDPFGGIIDNLTMTKTALPPEVLQNQYCAGLFLSGAGTFPASCN